MKNARLWVESRDSNILTNRCNFKLIQIRYKFYIPVLVSHFYFTISLLTACLQCPQALTWFWLVFVRFIKPHLQSYTGISGRVKCCTIMSFMDDEILQQIKIPNIFHFNIDVLSPDFKFSWSISEQSRIWVMLTVLTTYFMCVESLEKSSIFLSSHFPCQCFILPCLHPLLLTCPPLLTCLISTHLLCHFSFLFTIGLLESSHYFSTFSYCCCNRILHYHSQFVRSLKMKHYVCFMYNQIFLDASHIVVVRNNF
jgi:hypothetical protein